MIFYWEIAEIFSIFRYFAKHTPHISKITAEHDLRLAEWSGNKSTILKCFNEFNWVCENGDANGDDDDVEDTSGKRGQQHHWATTAAGEHQWRQREVQTIVCCCCCRGGGHTEENGVQSATSTVQGGRGHGKGRGFGAAESIADPPGKCMWWRNLW